jgi:NAD dependent epimerase/dehydratase family enzyme
MVREMMLGGQRVLPAALQASGFTFAHPGLEDALRHTLA